LDPDANEGGDSSDATATAGRTPQSDSQADASTQQTDATADEGKLSEAEVRSKIAHDILKKSESQTDDAGDGEGSDVHEKDTTDEEAEEESGEGDEKSEESDASQKTESSVSDKGPVPYKRFQETVREKQELEKQTKAWEPLVKAQNQINEVLNSAGVSLEEFHTAVDFLVLSKSDPVQALAKIKPMLGELSQFADDAIPAETQAKINGLAARVTEGELSQAAADELKAAWLEQVKISKQVKLNEKKGQQTEGQRQAAYVRSFVDAASAWGNSKQKTDPDYKPKSGANAQDGLYELTEAFFTRGMATVKLNTPQDLIKLLESSYTTAKGILKPAKNGATKPQPTSRGATTVRQPEAKTMREVASRVAAKHGISFSPK